MPTRDWWTFVMTPSAPYEKSKSLGSGGSMVARLKLKEIDGRAPPVFTSFFSYTSLAMLHKGILSQGVFPGFSPIKIAL